MRVHQVWLREEFVSQIFPYVIALVEVHRHGIEAMWGLCSSSTESIAACCASKLTAIPTYISYIPEVYANIRPFFKLSFELVSSWHFH